MKKFICGHCGGRIAVPPKHLGRLVTCPDCGKPTHPLAADILAAARTDEPTARSPAAAADRHCENCGKKIGRLEEPRVWQKHVVCAGCHEKLTPPDNAAAASASTAPARRRGKRDKSPEQPTPALLEQSAVPKALPAPATTQNLPVPAEGAVVELPAGFGRAVAGHLKTLVLSKVRPQRVAVQRAAIESRAGRVSATINVHPLAIRYRVLILLAVAFLAGVFLYGFLAIVRDFMGILTTLALGLVVVALAIGVGKVGWFYFVRWLRLRGKNGAGDKQDTIVEGKSTDA
jgi:predicted RNA-binding Zn-ribbon protein involved in translation (DUF1610 family)